MTIGTRISTLRKAKGYSQEYLAQEIGISRQAVHKNLTAATTRLHFMGDRKWIQQYEWQMINKTSVTPEVFNVM